MIIVLYIFFFIYGCITRYGSEDRKYFDSTIPTLVAIFIFLLLYLLYDIPTKFESKFSREEENLGSLILIASPFLCLSISYLLLLALNKFIQYSRRKIYALAVWGTAIGHTVFYFSYIVYWFANLKYL